MERKTLFERHCFRCLYTWWPRKPKPPCRCARCKSPYWNRPRLKGVQNVGEVVKKPSSIASPKTGSAVASTSVPTATPAPPPKPEPDRSFAKALTVLHQMKSTGATWAQMAERLRQDFDVQLDKDQVKGLVRQ